MANALLYVLGLLCAAAPVLCQNRECTPRDEPGGASLIQQRHRVQRLAAHSGEENIANPSKENGRPQGLAQKAIVNSDKVNGAKEHQLGLSRLVSRLTGRGFCRRHPCSLLLSDGDKRRGIGGTASLNEAGYREVAGLKDDSEMKSYIIRVIKDYNCKVEDLSELMAFVPWFSGTKAEQSHAKLENGLFFAVLADGRPWISCQTVGINGSNASLDDEGYAIVAVLRNDEEMKVFVRRLCKSLSIKINDEGGFEDMIKYFSEAAAFQSFDALVSELTAAANSPHAWADFE